MVGLMANPQTEEGFTQISNELFQKIIETKFTGTQYAIIFALIRTTYGYRIKSKRVGVAWFAKITGRGRSQLTRELKKLIQRNILIVKKSYNVGLSRELQLNKDYETWLDERGCSLTWV